MVYLLIIYIFVLRAQRAQERRFVDSNQAEKRAAQLLNETLSVEQLSQLALGHICVPSRVSGFSYHVGCEGSVYLFAPDGMCIGLCITPRQNLPRSDHILAMVRHLQADEAGLIKKAGFYGRLDVRKQLLLRELKAQRPT
ncbi:MAG: hypothetical protein WAP74_01875 [Patescibacteria group bacterium]